MTDNNSEPTHGFRLQDVLDIPKERMAEIIDEMKEAYITSDSARELVVAFVGDAPAEAVVRGMVLCDFLRWNDSDNNQQEYKSAVMG